MLISVCSPQHSVLSFVLCFCSPVSLKLLISCVMLLLIGALGSCACLSFVFVVHSFFQGVYCLHSLCCGAGFLGKSCHSQFVREQLIPVSSISLVYGGFLDIGEQRVLLAVGPCRARLQHTITVLTLILRTCQLSTALQPGSERLRLCRAKARA